MDVATQGLTNVGSTVRLIALQFSFSNPDIVPRCVRQLPQETPDETLKRTRPPSGETVIAPVENVGLVEFLSDLEQNGYTMVDDFSQRRFGQDNKEFHMVRVVFARREYAQPSDEFVRVVTAVRQALRTICEEAMWRVRGFLNSLFVEGQEIRGEHAVDITLTARKPLFDNHGQPVKRWRNADGYRLGNAPVPIQPDYLLRFIGDQIRVDPVLQAAAV